MNFTKEYPRVLIHFEENNAFAKGFFVYLQDKVPFMDTLNQIEPTNLLEHTRRYGDFDLYFHLVNDSHELLEQGVYHKGYYVDNKGDVQTPRNASIIHESTYEELWERVKREN
tara:strand:- start:365 stop:703 length:339 start_codon:yes stop_codon:yes gene_type:complete